jgi:hypothetical protein
MKIRPLLLLMPLLVLGCDREDRPSAQKEIIRDVALIGQEGQVTYLTQPVADAFPSPLQLTPAGGLYQTQLRVNESELPTGSGKTLLLVRLIFGPNKKLLQAEAYPWQPDRIQNGALTLPGTQLYPAQIEQLVLMLVRPRRRDAPIPVDPLPLPNPDVFLRDYKIIQRLPIRPEILRYLRCFLVTIPPCDQARCRYPYELAFDKLIFLARDGTTMKEVLPADCLVTLDPTKAKRDTTIAGARSLTYDVRAVIRRLRAAPSFGGTYGIVGNNSAGTLYSDVVGRTPSASGFPIPAAVGSTVEVNFTLTYTNPGGSYVGFRELFVTNSGTIERLPTAACFQMRRIAEDWIKVRINGEPGGCKL